MYIEEVNIRLQHLLKSKEYFYFDDLCRNLKGAFPDIIYKLLSNQEKLHFQEQKPIISYSSYSTPEPNIAEYEWRFSPLSIAKISSLINNNNANIALFGTPTIFYYLSKTGYNATLFDNNDILTSESTKNKIVNIDLNKELINVNTKFDYVIMDPPWYLAHYHNWIHQASRIIKPNGEIIISLFQELLRPNAKEELYELQKLFLMLGSTEILHNFITYETPFFEKELFTYLRIPINHDWRTSDLAIIRAERDAVTVFNKIDDDTKWKKYIIGNQTIALKFDSFSQNEIKVNFPYPNNGTLLKSVSNRYPKRSSINFITSRNRALIIQGQDKLGIILNDYSKTLNIDRVFTQTNLTSQEQEAVKIIFSTFGY